MITSYVDDFHANGWAALPRILDFRQCDALLAAVESLPELVGERRKAGHRGLLRSCAAVRDVARENAIRDAIATVLSPAARCVKALWFDKTPAANWRVPWHQDLMIAVRERHDVDGYTAWSSKHEAPHVKPPAELLGRMATLRIHLDDCDVGNGPLRVLPGSHRRGELSQAEIAVLAGSVRPVEITINRGDALLMRPLLLHSSPRAERPRRRRVLHLEFTDASLPPPLTWYDRV